MNGMNGMNRMGAGIEPSNAHPVHPVHPVKKSSFKSQRARQKDRDGAREEEKLITTPHNPSAMRENSTHHGMDRPSSVQSTLPHSPEPVSTFVTTCVTGMISSR